MIMIVIICKSTINWHLCCYILQLHVIELYYDLRINDYVGMNMSPAVDMNAMVFYLFLGKVCWTKDTRMPGSQILCYTIT